MKLASRKVLLHDMKSIEALARVDVLCVDKTGTITEPTMNVKQIICSKNGKNLLHTPDVIAGITCGLYSCIERQQCDDAGTPHICRK